MPGNTDEDTYAGQRDFEQQHTVFPTVASVTGSVDVQIEQNRIRMREEDTTTATIGVANREINTATPLATIHMPIDSENDTDTIYAELALNDLEAVKQLRDSLTKVIQYRKQTD